MQRGRPIQKSKSGKQIIYTKHAEERMSGRGLGQDDILDLIDYHSIRCPDASGKNLKLMKTVDGVRRTVIIAESSDTITVITAYSTASE